MKLRKTEIVLLTLGIVTTAALMVSPIADISKSSALIVSGKTDISAGLAERALAVHRSGTVKAPAAEVKPVELPIIFVQSHEEPVILDFEPQDEEMFVEANENVSESEITPEPEPTEEASEDSGMTYLGTYTISGYCSCVECEGIWSGSPTASGAYPTDGWTCASNSLPFGTMVYIEGFGVRCVEDRGDSIMTDDWLDLYFDDHDNAQSVGLQNREVYLINE